MTGQLYINGEWKDGNGELFGSFNPATFERIWEGNAASSADIDDVMEAALHQCPQRDALARRQFAGLARQGIRNFDRDFHRVSPPSLRLFTESWKPVRIWSSGACVEQ